MNTIDSVSAPDASPALASPAHNANGMATAPTAVEAPRPQMRAKRAPRAPRATAATAATSAVHQPITRPATETAITQVTALPSAQSAKTSAKTPTKARATVRATEQHTVAEADFLDLAGHELRAPMTILKGQGQLLQRRLRREGGREADLGDLDKMLFQVERLNHQVGALLDATHLAQRRLTLVPVEFDLAASLQRIVVMCAAGNPNVTLHYDAATGPLIGRWDRQRTESVIRELLFNALKYGGNQISVRLTREPNPTQSHEQHGQHANAQARIEVEDHGIGVPAGERRAIFGERARASNAAHAGVGLGLYIAREIVRRQHGRIGVRPRAPKGAPGSVFWMTLPLTPA